MMRTRRASANRDADALRANMTALRLPFMLEHHQTLAQSAADKHWSHLDYLTELVSGEAGARDDRRVQRCIQLARFPVLKTLDTFDWNWPTKINRLLIQNLFHLDFVANHGNVVFISTTGLGKSHLMTALGHAACQRGHSVLFTGAIEMAERRTQKSGLMSGGEQQMLAVARGLMPEPEVLIIDELSLGLSPLLALTLFESLVALKEQGLTMRLVEQNVAMALAVSDYAYVLAQGKVWLEGEARSLLKNDEIRQAYLGISH